MSAEKIYRTIMNDRKLMRLHYNVVNTALPTLSFIHTEYYLDRLNYLNEIGLFVTGIESTYPYWPKTISISPKQFQ